MNKTSLYWTTTTEYVDLETGEQIQMRTKKETEEHIRKQYTIIKKRKYVTTTVSRGNIKYTVECRKRPEQRELAFS